MENYIEKLFNLKDKVAVVVGGGGHICSEIVKAFAMTGCKVAILDIRMKKSLLVEKSLRKKGYVSLMSMEIDVSQKTYFIQLQNGTYCVRKCKISNT